MRAKMICEALINCQKITLQNGATISGFQSVSCDSINCDDIQACVADKSVHPAEIKMLEMPNGSGDSKVGK